MVAVGKETARWNPNDGYAQVRHSGGSWHWAYARHNGDAELNAAHLEAGRAAAEMDSDFADALYRRTENKIKVWRAERAAGLHIKSPARTANVPVERTFTMPEMMAAFTQIRAMQEALEAQESALTEADESDLETLEANAEMLAGAPIE